jgi:hypothetical protein
MTSTTISAAEPERIPLLLSADPSFPGQLKPLSSSSACCFRVDQMKYKEQLG